MRIKLFVLITEGLRNQHFKHLNKRIRKRERAEFINEVAQFGDENVSISVIQLQDKANKSIRGMPGRFVPTKDVVHCEKLW
jgi:hypothetical protein